MGISAYDQINYAQYKPISFQEMWAPAQMMREQEDKLSEEYANAEQIAQQGFSGLDPTIDKVALDTQKKFIEQTKMAADELVTKGFIDAGRRRNLLQLKSVYLNQIVPYQQQIALRASRADEARKIQMADRSYKLSKDPMSVSLDEGLRNPNAYNYAGVSGEKVYKDTAQAMEQVKQIAAQELPQRVSSGLLNQYYTLQKHGLQPDEAAKIMAQNSENDAQRQTWSKIGKLTLGAIHGSLSRNGVYDVFKDKPEVINEFWRSASDAALFGLGQTSIGNMTDEMEMYKRKKALEVPPSQPNKPNLGDPIQITTDEGKRLVGGEAFQNVRFLTRRDLIGPYSKAELGTVLPNIPMGASKEVADRARERARQMDLTIKNYAKNKGITGKSSEEIFNILKQDRQYLEDRAKLLNHNLRPIINNMASNNIMGNAFSSNVGATKFVNFDSGSYTGDMSTGINLESIAKSIGTTTAGIQKYLRDNNIKPNFDETSGLYTVSIPSSLVKDKDNYLPGKNAKSMTIGFATQAGHQSAVEKIEVVRNAMITGSQEQVRITKEPIKRIVDGVEYWQQDVYYPKEDKVYNIYYKTKSGAMNRNKKDIIHQAPMAGDDYIGNHLSNILNNTLNESENVSELQDKSVNLTSGW